MSSRDECQQRKPGDHREAHEQPRDVIANVAAVEPLEEARGCEQRAHRGRLPFARRARARLDEEQERREREGERRRRKPWTFVCDASSWRTAAAEGGWCSACATRAAMSPVVGMSASAAESARHAAPTATAC